MVYIVRSILIISHYVHACPDQDYFSRKFAVMYYGNNSCIGVRQKFGDKKQIMSFGGKKAGHSESALRSWADDVLIKLDAGQPTKLVKDWILATISPEL